MKHRFSFVGVKARREHDECPGMTWYNCQAMESSFSGSASENIRGTVTDNTRYAEQVQEREPACLAVLVSCRTA